MQTTEEWWHSIVKMYAKLIENFDSDILSEFMHELDTIPYADSKPYDGLEIGSPYVCEIAGWYDDASNWSSAYGDYDAAVNCLERALDYYCDPILDFDDDVIDEAKERMDSLVTKTIIGIYEGSHEL